ncbi:MAG: type I restriction enzyme endonuclease domain-containing protein [Rectinema subterraneum]
MAKKNSNGANLGFEAELWKLADALRSNMDAAEYKHVVLGLIFLKYISDAFEEQHAKLEAERAEGADPEDPDEYQAVNVFWVPQEARWSHLRAHAKQPDIGKIIDNAMIAIERDNPSLKGVLPKDYARPALDKQRLGQLIDLIGNIGLGDRENRSKDILGRVYEYFLSQFASAEGKKGGQFYTPRCIVRTLVEMIQPYKGRVYDPCCGSGGMFVQSEKFVEAHGGRVGDISIYGQESNHTTWRLAKMNLAIRGIVDYLGLADELRHALATYTESGGTGRTAIDQEEAVALMLEKYEICCDLFHGFDWGVWKSGAAQDRLSLLPAAQEHILAQDDGKNRLSKAVAELSKAFALAVPHDRALEIRDDVAFFQAVKSVLSKRPGAEDGRSPEELDHAIRQIVSRAVSSDEVIDIFAAAGLKKPDISILSEEFLAEVRGMPQKNLAVEMLRKLLEGEISARSRKNIVQARSFAQLLEEAIRKYQNRAIETAQVIEELLALAKEVREADRRGEQLGLTDDEIAFYDALETNDSAVSVLGDEKLKLIAQELVKAVRANLTIDWAVRESVRAKMRVIIKRILKKYGYPPDHQARATELVLEQAEVICREWAE